MIVVDASIAVELILQRRRAQAIERFFRAHPEMLIVPGIFDLEVFSALRRPSFTDQQKSYLINEQLRSFADFPAERLFHAPLIHRIWQLRNNFTCYDAAYIVLAELTNSLLVTLDAKLATGHKADVTVFERGALKKLADRRKTDQPTSLGWRRNLSKPN